MFDWTINLGHVLTFIGIIGGIWAYSRGQNKEFTLLAERMGVLGGRMVNVENEMKKMTEVLTTLAVQDQRMIALEQRQTIVTDRLNQIEKSADDWRQLMIKKRIEALDE